MVSIRTTKTNSGATAIQVVDYRHGKTQILKHIGSAHNRHEVSLLWEAACQWIETVTGQLNLFASETKSPGNNPPRVLLIKQIKSIKTQPKLLYEVFSSLLRTLGLDGLSPSDLKDLFLDLILMRLINPGSKLEAIEYLADRFDIFYKRSDVYRKLLKMNGLKAEVEGIIINYAKKHLNFNFTLVFYDVTTLYFESAKADDDLRQYGFSKDNKANQPQLTVGLLVNETGYPVSFELFAGNKFEGHTLLPTILKLKKTYGIKNLTVVADAAMISEDNVSGLKDHGLSYIVGARVANLNPRLLDDISQRLGQKDGDTLRVTTSKGDLILSFSKERFAKDKHETEKQLSKAERYVADRRVFSRKPKFISVKASHPSINHSLLERTKLLWGIKGYYTNTHLSDREVINHYHNLWHVEHAFRMAKSDLKARPIFHHQTRAIEAHLLICFAALAVARVVELKTKLSLRNIIRTLSKIQDTQIQDGLTGKTISLRNELDTSAENILKGLDFPY